MNFLSSSAAAAFEGSVGFLAVKGAIGRPLDSWAAAKALSKLMARIDFISNNRTYNFVID